MKLFYSSSIAPSVIEKVLTFWTLRSTLYIIIIDSYHQRVSKSAINCKWLLGRTFAFNEKILITFTEMLGLIIDSFLTWKTRNGKILHIALEYKEKTNLKLEKWNMNLLNISSLQYEISLRVNLGPNPKQYKHCHS